MNLTCLQLPAAALGLFFSFLLTMIPEAAVAAAPEESWPRVQRGDTDAGGDVRPTRGIALGFEEGTILFDADQLQPVSCWFGGFVQFSDQAYFGRYWAKAGEEAPDTSWFQPRAFKLQFPGKSEWQTFPLPLESDPNEGSRFEGYQLGETAIRLRYRLVSGAIRIGVIEDVRMEARLPWQGMARNFTFTGLPEGARIGLEFPSTGDMGFFTAEGNPVAQPDVISALPIAAFRSGERPHLVVASGSSGWRWETFGANRLLAFSPDSGSPAQERLLRLECWRTRDTQALGPVPAEALQELVRNPIELTGSYFDLSREAAAAPELPGAEAPESDGSAAPNPTTPAREHLLPALNYTGNTETFPPVQARRLRLTIEATNSGGGAGIDELEVFGPGSEENLARKGLASASSLIPGYPIHQVAHLNDGLAGNEHSWVAEAEKAWVQIDWPMPVEIDRLVWARDRTGVCRDRLANNYRVDVAGADGAWSTVCSAADHEPLNTLDAEEGYRLQSIPMPFDDCRPSDIAFDDDGIMYLIAMTRGEVWRTRRPPVAQPERVRWQRFARGLNHPIGLQVIDGRVYVAQKPEISELIDRDGDGTADYYRTVASGWGLSQGWHEYTFGLAADDERNLWFTLNTGFFWTNPGYVNPGRLRGSILRVDHDSERLTEVARGCRVPNGITSGAEGGIFYTDNQGDWIQSCKLAHVIPGRFYGHPETRDDALPEGEFPDGRSAVWLPYDRSRSTSGPAFDNTGGTFGPFDGQFFVGDVGYGGNPGIMRLALEKIGEQWQGACFRFTDGQPLGCERMKFGPDGRLYQASLTSGLTALRFHGADLMAIHSMRLRPGGTGFVLQLTQPLANDVAVTAAQFRFRRYHYLYGGNYGSPEEDSQPVDVSQVSLSSDRKTITLSLPIETHPIGMVYELTAPPLKAANGHELKHPEAWYTVQRIP